MYDLVRNKCLRKDSYLQESITIIFVLIAENISLSSLIC